MASPPQWPRTFPVRTYRYAHTQPQWAAGASLRLSQRPAPLPDRSCAACGRSKRRCRCRACAVCQSAVRSGTRHHCRRCWRAACGPCWTRSRHVHMRAPPVRVCDDCAVPRALAQCGRPTQRGAMERWGLYALRCAAEMANACVNPTCRWLTYGTVCRMCGLPAVATQPHVERSIQISEKAAPIVAHMDMQERAARHAATLAYEKEAREPEASFRAVFPRYEELDAFASVTCARDAQDLLLAVVAASIAYAYDTAPSITLALSELPYARVLRVISATPKYTVFEAPGRVKFIALPGTHNARTLAVNLRYGIVTRTQWSHVVGGISASDRGSEVVSGGVKKVWEYHVHGGFAQESEETLLPVEQLVADVRQGYRLVFSGHSLGGAIAQLLALRLLRAYPGEMKDNIRCVTLGAPLVGNYQLALLVERCGWRSNFHHFVYRSDLIPRAMCVDQITRDMAKRLLLNATSISSSVHQWFTYNQRSTTPTKTDSPEDEKELEEIAKNIDMRIKQGEELIEDGDVDVVYVSNHRTHRTYACFGRYHFLNHCNGRYYSTDDSEKAFYHLKNGCGSATRVSDHSVASYIRAITLHLYMHQLQVASGSS